MIHRRGFLLIGLLVLALVAAPVFGQSATPQLPASPDTPPLRDDTLLHDTSLLDTDSDCRPPCWHGITPGETAWNNALSLIGADSDFDVFQFQEQIDSDAKIITFRERGGTHCCEVYTEDRITADVILLRLAPDMMVSEVLTALGQPHYARGSTYTDDQATMNLIYAEQSLVVYAFVAGENGLLRPSSPIIGALYMTPDGMDQVIATSNLYYWKGYQPFSVYYDALYDLAPSILTPTPTNP